MIERPYDGCGKCLLGVRRLSRMKLATSSQERQREDVLTAAASVGGHIIGRADDWEVSGATDPMTRPRLGPWLRDERGSGSSPGRGHCLSSVRSRVSARQARSKSARCRLSFSLCARESPSAPAEAIRMAASG